MSETVRKLCAKAKLEPPDSIQSTEENLELQEPAQKKIRLNTGKKNSQNNVSENISTNQLSTNMDDEDTDEPVPEAGPANYMSFLLSLSQEPQDEESVEAFSPEAPSLDQGEDTSSSESESASKEEKNYEVDIEKTKEILAVLHEMYPDEMEAVIHTRNEWGKVLYEKYPYKAQLSVQDSQLQDVLAQWKRWSMKGKTERDTPYSYKCYLCDRAWWSFEHFRTHIKQHTSCKIQMETSYRDFNIVAFQGNKARFKELPVDGNCSKCAKTYEYHVASKKLSDKYYSCLYCYRMFESCRALSKHTGTCDSNPVLAESRKQLTFTEPPCEICGAFLTSSEMSEHLTICHSVRSDEPIVTLVKKCHLCDVTFYVKEYHVCLKKMVSHCCSYCRCKFQNIRFLNSHLKLWNGEYGVRKREVQCKRCKKAMKPCMLGAHYLDHSSNFLMVHRCVVCDNVKLFETEEELTEHRRIHHRSFNDKIFIHKIAMAKVMLQQCIIGEISENGFLKNEYDVDNEEQSSASSDDEIMSDSLSTCEQEVQSTPGSSSENDDTTVSNEGSQSSNTDNVISENDTIVIKDENDDENNPQKNEEVPEEDDGNVVKEENIGTGEEVDIVQLGEDSDINLKTEKDNENDSLIIDNEVPQDENVKNSSNIVKREDATSESTYEEHADVENSNKIIENEDIVDDNACKEGNESNKVLPKLIEELNEFLDLKPDVVGVKEENVSDDEGCLKIVENESESSISKVQSLSIIVKEEAEKSELKVFHVTKSLLESETAAVAQAIKQEQKNDLIVLDDSSDDEILSDIQKSKQREKVLDIEPEEILAAGYKKRKTYRCTKCNFTGYHKEYKEHVNSRCKIKKHIKPDESEWSYKCSKCQTYFPTLRRYVVHFKRHGYHESQCPQCRCQFENVPALESHINSHIKNQFVRVRVITTDEEETRGRIYKCKDCTQVDASNDSFTHWESHLDLSGNEGSENAVLVPFSVNGRGQHALKPGLLKELIAKLLEDKLKMISCFLCSREIASSRIHDAKRHLIEHLLEDAIANVVDNRHLKCQICSELHVKPDLYKKHMRDHAGLPVYQCSICDKCFSDSSNFVKHKKVHNLEIFVCDICNKKFQRIESLEKHMKTHSVKVEPLRCEFCSKEFQCPSLYRKHVRSSHFKKPLRCYLCHKNFDTKPLKDQHLWNVHKVRGDEADCPVCGLEFRTVLEVKKHARDEHGVTVWRVGAGGPPGARGTPVTHKEKNSEGEGAKDGEGEVAKDGEGEVAKDGEGEVAKDGEGEVAKDGEGEVAKDGEGEVAKDGEGEVAKDGEGEVAKDGEGEVAKDRESDDCLVVEDATETLIVLD